MKLHLVQRKTLLPDVECFVFKPTEPVTWQAGQYCHYVLHHEPTDTRGSDRWFTISSAPFEDIITITTRFAEKSSSFKQVLRGLQHGETIEISNVSGRFVVDDVAKEYVFIAGGIGITPFHAILKQLDHEKKQIKVTLLYANRDTNIIYKDELDKLAQKHQQFSWHAIISPKRIDDKKIRELAPDIKTSYFYISGPEPMVEGIQKTLFGMNVAENHIKLDSFPGYPGI